MQVKATAKQLRISPRKMGLVASLVRRRKVEDALTILENTPKKGAGILREVVKSAAANAENNHKLTKTDLLVESVLVSPGFVLKRFKAGSRGRVDPQARRTSHVTVIVEGKELAAKPATKEKK